MIIEGPHLGAPGERLQIIHTNIIMEKKKKDELLVIHVNCNYCLANLSNCGFCTKYSCKYEQVCF